MSNLITDFRLYCSAYEIPPNYATFAAIGLLGAAFNRRIFCLNGDIPVHGNVYTCLVGKQGNKKSTAQDFARDIFQEVYPDIPVAPSVQSREDIVKFMSSDDDKFYFKNYEGIDIEYHPYMLFINELEMFMSFNPAGMVSFLTDIFDRKFFDAGTIKRGLEKIPNPCINFMSCCTPDWLISRLKGFIISGGFFRRTIVVYEPRPIKEDGSPLSVPRPIITPIHIAAKQRVIDHLIASKQVAAKYEFTHLGELYFDEFYHKNKLNLPEDPILEGYLSTIDTQLRKICMLIDAASPNPTFKLSDELLQVGEAILKAVLPNLAQLSVATSRNEMVLPQMEMLEILRRNNGEMTEKQWLIESNKKMNDIEYHSMMKHFRSTSKAFSVNRGGSNGHAKTVILDAAKMLEEQEKLGK